MCDMRRAVIAVNIIAIVLAVIAMCLYAVSFAMWEQASQATVKHVSSTETSPLFTMAPQTNMNVWSTDDWSTESSPDWQTTVWTTESSSNWQTSTSTSSQYFLMSSIPKVVLVFLIAFQGISILFYSLGIHGARKFNMNMVVTALVFHMIDAIISLFTLNIAGVFFSALFVYPHVMLFREIKQGVMTEGNYPSQKKTCCGP
jgi:hypothetical protein